MTAPVPPEGRGEGPERLTSAEGHLGWRVSALLDGELLPAEEGAARAHLSTCDRCDRELAEVMAARSLVRDLGIVEPPRGFLDQLVSTSQQASPLRFGAVALAGIAALWIILLIVVASVALPQVVPPVDDFVRQHEVAATDPELLPTLEPVEVLDGTGDDLAPPYVLPEELAASFERVVAYDKGEGVIQALYRSEGVAVSLFQQEGSLDWDRLPDGGEVRDVGGTRAWVGTVDAVGGVPGVEASGSRAVVVVPDGDLVYTLVTADPAEVALDLVADLPDPGSTSWYQRIRRRVGLE